MPDFDTSYPRPETLKTGDLLLPRGVSEAAAQPPLGMPALGVKSTQLNWSLPEPKLDLNSYGSTTLRELLSDRLQVQPEDLPKRLKNLESLDTSQIAPRLMEAQKPSALSASAGLDLPGFDNLFLQEYGGVLSTITAATNDFSLSKAILIFKIAQRDFPELVKEWLGMSMFEFALHPVARFLFNALEVKDGKFDFFIGHVGMVVVEHGVPYVFDANLTSFCHYRCAVHPYYIPPSEDTVQAASRRGWLNQRMEMGQRVWQVRPALPAGYDEEVFSNTAKKYLGRPYGFFDDPEFGDSNRLYCSEYVWRVFKDAFNIQLADATRTWGWMRAFFEESHAPEELAMVSDIIESGFMREDAEFFLLHPAMLWSNTSLTHVFSPISPTTRAQEAYAAYVPRP